GSGAGGAAELVKGAAGAVGVGGGLYVRGGSFKVGNTIAAANDGDDPLTTDVAGTFASLGHNLIGNAGDGRGGWLSSDLIGTPQSQRAAKLASVGNYGGPTPTLAPI